MKTISIAALVLLVVGCSSTSGASGADGPDGSWVYTNSAGTAGLGAIFNSDGTYTLTEIALTSSTSANAQVEGGTFTLSGNKITETPTKASCDGPIAVHEINYSVANGDLTLSDSSAVVILKPNTSTASNVAVVIGCFDSNGNFTAHPVAAVSN